VVELTNKEAEVIRMVLRKSLVDLQVELHAKKDKESLLYELLQREVNDTLKALSYL